MKVMAYPNGDEVGPPPNGGSVGGGANGNETHEDDEIEEEEEEEVEEKHEGNQEEEVMNPEEGKPEEEEEDEDEDENNEYIMNQLKAIALFIEEKGEEIRLGVNPIYVEPEKLIFISTIDMQHSKIWDKLSQLIHCVWAKHEGKTKWRV